MTPEAVALISPHRFLHRSTIAELNDAFRRQGVRRLHRRQRSLWRARSKSATATTTSARASSRQRAISISASSSCSTARPRPAVSIDTTTPGEHTILYTVTSPTTGLTGSAMRTVIVSPADQQLSPEPAKTIPSTRAGQRQCFLDRPGCRPLIASAPKNDGDASSPSRRDDKGGRQRW